MDRSPGTLVIWLVAAVLAVVVGLWLAGGGGGSDGGTPVRLVGGDQGGQAAAGTARAGGRGGGSSGAAPAAGGGSLAYVHIAGAVRSPGLYRVTAGARVANALERAGGALPRADLAAVNLAARVEDGQQIVVPRLGASGGPGGSGGAAGGGTAGAAAGVGGVKPSLGSATVEQLDTLDGIGPMLAHRIVEYRTQHGGFRSIGELAEVEGIGEKRLQSLREELQP